MWIPVAPSLRLIWSRRTTEEQTSPFSSFPESITISLDVTELTVVLEGLGYMVQGCTVPLEPLEDLEVPEDHVGLVPHVDQEDRVDHLLE